MVKHYRRKIYIILGLTALLVVILAFYLNRSYAYIYRKIDASALIMPDRIRTYSISNRLTATTSLVYSAMGDSLTSGVGTDNYQNSYPYLLAQYLAGNHYQVTLKNRSVPGAKSADLLLGLLTTTIQDNPDVVTLLIGVNDIHGEIPITEFERNYEQILSRLTKETKAKIYVINIPFIGASDLIWPPYASLFNEQTQKFNEVIKRLAAKHQVKYIDLYTVTLDLFKKPGSHYASDSFHPSSEGYKIWADLIYADFNK